MQSGFGSSNELEPEAKMTVLDSSCSTLTKDQTACLTEGGAATRHASGRPDKQRQGSGYFQQLFHAPNGNLFSVLSPLQQRGGRFCSMKPAFLCRQPAQQQQGQRATRSRSGRRGGGSRCLKFHNFIPSESITSEKDDGSHDDVWKVHAECKLQEEHGTKQIMVSQWSVSSSDAPPPSSSSSSFVQAATESRHSAGNDTAASTEAEKATPSQLASRLRVEVTRRQPASTCPPPAPSPTNRAADTSGPSTDSRPQQQVQVTYQAGPVVAAVTAPPPAPADEEALRATPGCFIPSRSSELLNELASSSCCSEDVPSRTDSAPASPNCVADASADTSVKQSEILFECLSKRHRRKPSQTRRVVPYRKYLSLLENDEASNASHPLDLSMKTRVRATEDAGATVGNSDSCCFSPAVCGASPFVPCCLPACSSQPYLPSVPSEHYHFPYQDPRTSVSGSFEKSPLQVALEAPLTTTPNRRLYSAFSQPSPLATLGHQSMVSASVVPTTQLPFGYALYSTPTSASGAGVRPSHPLQPQSHTDCSGSGSRSALMAVLQNCRDPRTSSGHGSSTSPSPSEAPRGLRKPSQRSLIKQKLEDTFKQNGFLVKTKQVSDGDATFCKFRQLRKYTRYYLKSWHHHLPAEVHKLWKGFLPPKTLPGPGSSVDDVARDASQGSLSLPQ
ncbi:uncharacterized protein LOC142564115 isoform X1 [Dermacentor variabilis]|uniref:uncharacterized protein LOC142564115 isoform X1 n=2 Tax=Dermacentor variabilis TaxID=34621 RepID=UPI003F5C3493